jgi:hypothetical protein
VDLHIAREPACSSSFSPIEGIGSVLPLLACTDMVGSQTVPVTTLDRWCADNGVDRVDALKLDVQGAERDVLLGAERCLERVQLIEVEVAFNPIYVDQPLFADVDSLLRGHGFRLWRLSTLVHYSGDVGRPTPSPSILGFFDSRPQSMAAEGGQLYWGDAVYARAELCPAGGRPSSDQSARAARLALALGHLDLAESAMGSAAA